MLVNQNVGPTRLVVHTIYSDYFPLLFGVDFRIIENELFKQDWRSRKKVQIFQYIVLKWGFALLIGVFTGLVGIFNNIAVENIARCKLLLNFYLMSERRCFKDTMQSANTL